jgi:hypothetical protein
MKQQALFLAALWITFSSSLFAGHKDLGLRSNYSQSDKLQPATNMDSYGASMCMCGDYNKYPLLFPQNELIVAFPTEDKDERLVHIWNPSGFNEICGGPCNRSMYDGRKFYYINNKYLDHDFEIYEPRTIKNYWPLLFNKLGHCKIERLDVVTSSEKFSYDLKHCSVDYLIYEIKVDMFLRYIIHPLVIKSGIIIDNWKLTLEENEARFINFNMNDRKTELTFPSFVTKPQELIQVIETHLCENFDQCGLAQKLLNVNFANFNEPHAIKYINKAEINNILAGYLAVIKTLLIPEESVGHDYDNEQVSAISYGKKYYMRFFE